MANLTNLFNSGAGATGSFFTGQEHVMDQEKAAATLQELMMKNEQTAAMNPLDLEAKRQSIAQSKAMLPGVEGQAKSLAAQGTFDQETLQSRLATKFSEVATQLGKDGVARLEQDGDRIRQFSAIASKYPPAAHKQIFEAVMQKTGGDPDGALIKQFSALPDDQFLPALSAVGNAMATAGSKFVQERTLKKDENDSQERVNKLNNDTKTETARIAAEARIAAANARSSAMMKSLATPDKQIAYLEMIPEADRTPAEQNALFKLKEYMLTKAAAGANATTPAVLGQASPMQNASEAAKAMTPPVVAQPQTQAPAAKPVAGGDFAALAKQQGLSYEPEKYHYRVNNGKLERKAK